MRSSCGSLTVGKKMAAELRWFCPSRNAPEERRHLPSTRRAAAHVLEQMRRAICAIEELERDASNADDGEAGHHPARLNGLGGVCHFSTMAGGWRPEFLFFWGDTPKDTGIGGSPHPA
jgi:hypothetical protein